MIMEKRKGTFVHIISLALVCAICITITEFATFKASAELNEYNETNGTFDDFGEARIDSNIEEQYGVAPYYQTTTFSHTGNTAVIDSNSYVEWSTRSDNALLYKRYDVGGDGSQNQMTFETTLTTYSDPNGGNNLFSTASGGLLVTDSATDPTAPRVYLHYRQCGVTVVYRASKGSGMGVIYGKVEAKLPINMKIVKKGKKYSCSYKGANMSSYQSLGTVAIVMTGPLYAGVASHSSHKDLPIHTVYTGWYAVGKGTYSEESGDGESSSSEITYPDTGYIDPPFEKDTTLLYESFSKGIRKEGEESVENPLWKSAHTDLIKTKDDGNRQWYIAQEDGSSYLGNEYWTDYKASVDFSFTGEMQAQDDDQFIFWVRNRMIESSGYFGYGISITTDATVDSTTSTITYKTKLKVLKQFAQASTRWVTTSAEKEIENLIGDGIMHRLSVDVIDNNLNIYLDDKLVLTYTDTANDGRVNLRGGLGFYTNKSDVLIDNILVEKLNDPDGEDWDNYVADDYDSSMPQYVYDFYKKYGIKYFDNDSTTAVPSDN